MYQRLATAILIFISTIFVSPSRADEDINSKLIETINRLNRPKADRCQAFADPPVVNKENKAWSDAGFKNPQIKTFSFRPAADPSSKKFTHEFDLSLVMFRSAGWNAENVQASIARVSEIYGQCGIRLGTAKLVMVDPPNKWIDITYDRDKQMTKMAQKMSKPTLYFVRSSQEGHTAYAWTASSWNREICSRELGRCDTAWITNDIDTESYKKFRAPTYSPIAHELAHILGNCDHISGDTKNILGNSAETVNDQITAT